MSPVYLGDSVYATFDGWMIQIYTDNGHGPENIIYLEPAVMNALLQYFKQCFDKSNEKSEL